MRLGILDNVREVLEHVDVRAHPAGTIAKLHAVLRCCLEQFALPLRHLAKPTREPLHRHVERLDVDAGLTCRKAKLLQRRR